MKRRFVLVIILKLMVCSAVAQTRLPIREKIIPLRSNRAEVEKYAVFVKSSSDSVTYDTSTERIEVYYSKSPCDLYGWNVPPNTVVSYRVYPKIPLVMARRDQSKNRQFRLVTDSGHEMMSNESAGIEFLFNPESDNVVSVRYTATSKDDRLRCKGFPNYSPISENYSPYQVSEYRDNGNWSFDSIFATLARVRDDSSLRAYIFIYSGRENVSSAMKMKSELKKYVLNVIKSKSNLIVVELGGIRSGLEIETFLISYGNPIPMARPFFAKNK